MNYLTTPELIEWQRRQAHYLPKQVQLVEETLDLALLQPKYSLDPKEDSLAKDVRLFLETLQQQIQTGQPLAPLLVSHHYQILDGHHRYFAARALGIKKIPVLVVK